MVWDWFVSFSEHSVRSMPGAVGKDGWVSWEGDNVSERVTQEGGSRMARLEVARQHIGVDRHLGA